MASQPLAVPTKTADDLPDQLYRHATKPEWGLAVLAWERHGKRAYQFEDGRLRKIQEGYYDLLEPVEEGDRPLDHVRTNLKAAITSVQNGQKPKVLKPVCSFEEQIELFTKLFPEGFSDPRWIDEKRGSAEGHALKRHRVPSIIAAREALDPAVAEPLIQEGRQGELAEAVLDVLAGTDLVPLAHVKPLRRLDEEERAEYAEVVFDLAHGEDPLDDRFRTYLRMLTRLAGKRPSWRVATALLALTHPDSEVAVRRSAFIRQAGSIAPTGAYTRKPKVTSYRSFRRLALTVKARLEAAGQEPADLLDVHDFIWTTLRKSALEHLKP